MPQSFHQKKIPDTKNRFHASLFLSYLKKLILAGKHAAHKWRSDELTPNDLFPTIKSIGTINPINGPATYQGHGCFIHSSILMFIYWVLVLLIIIICLIKRIFFWANLYCYYKTSVASHSSSFYSLRSKLQRVYKFLIHLINQCALILFYKPFYIIPCTTIYNIGKSVLFQKSFCKGTSVSASAKYNNIFPVFKLCWLILQTV